MARHASKADGYRILLAAAEHEVEAARLAVAQHRHGAASKLRAAESYADSIRRKLDDGPAPRAEEPAFAADTLAPDFGVDDEEATR